MMAIATLISIMARLRDPITGCPWDIEQNFASIAPFTIEEAYEVADAIERGDMAGLKDELGDLLLQVVFHARMAEEQGLFAFDDVAAIIADKLVRRHPHIFGDASATTADDVLEIWQTAKDAERADKPQNSALDGVTVALPALTRAAKIQKRMSRAGFDWTDPLDVIAKLQEELDELKAEILAGDKPRACAELGDVLFTCAQIANHLDIEPETALRATTAKVEKRFRHVEAGMRALKKPMDASSFTDMLALWQAAKEHD